MLYLGNAFSLQMININTDGVNVSVKEIPVSQIPESVVSIVGHADTAAVLTGILGHPVPMNRVSLRLEEGDVLYVAQLTGGRLPEGCTTLPEGFKFKFYEVRVVTK